MEGPVAIILAAGHGKRMKSDKAKVLHEVCGRPMIRYVVDAAREAGAKKIIVVVGYGADQVRAALGNEPDIQFATQERQLGTGDAVKACRSLLEGYVGAAMVLVGDEPLIRAQPLADLLARQKAENVHCLLGTAIVPDPTGFGRILRDGAGRFMRIIEQRDCSPEEARINEVNPSCYVFELPILWDALDRLGTSNAQGEYYLTDAPELLHQMGKTVLALPVLHADDILGVNTREHLAEADSLMQRRILHKLLDEGVSLISLQNTYVDGRAKIGQGTVIHPFTVIKGDVIVGKNCQIGPFSHLRDGVVLEDDVQVGAFVELARTTLCKGTIARHHAYLGDATVGAGSNVGAGFITANFDGVNKSKSTIGENVTLGAGSILIAPVQVGDNATIGAGAIVTKNSEVAAGEVVVGVPARPLNKS